MHTTLWRLSQVLLSGGEAGAKGQRSVAHRIVAGAPPTQVPFPRGQQRSEGHRGVLEEAVFVLSLSARAGGLGWGPLHGVLGGQGNKNLVCKKGASTEAGLGLPQWPRQQARLCEVCVCVCVCVRARACV